MERDVADLVQEDGPAARELEAADAVAHRARERALHVAEELALEEVARERAAVHGHERPRARERARVERARDDFLAGAALPRDEDRRVAPVERLDEVDDLEHRRRARDEAVRRDHALEERVLVLGRDARRRGSARAGRSGSRRGAGRRPPSRETRRALAAPQRRTARRPSSRLPFVRASRSVSVGPKSFAPTSSSIGLPITEATIPSPRSRRACGSRG